MPKSRNRNLLNGYYRQQLASQACARRSIIFQKPDLDCSKSDGLTLKALNVSFRASLTSYFTRRVQSHNNIEDMVQEVFERLLRRGDLDSIVGVHGYLFETASSVLLDRARKCRTHHEDAHVEFDPERHSEVDFSPERVLLGRENLARATSALFELPERTRVIFVLRRLDGMTYLDIAARLNVSVSTVEKHMQRAVIHLMKWTD